MRESNRSEEQISLVETYCKANMLWRENEDRINYTEVVELDVSKIEPTVAGPKRPQDKILLREFKPTFIDLLSSSFEREYIEHEDRDSVIRWKNEGGNQPETPPKELSEGTKIETKEQNGLKTVWIDKGEQKYSLSDGSVVIAAITSCTNTSNPFVMVGAGLVAKKAREHGIDVKPWVKTSLAPGSKVVTDYLIKADLLKDLEALQFHLVG